MAKRSAGILLFREASGYLEVLLVHPGGPYWAKKDDGAWSIPKGELGEDEDPWSAARREFEEETGFTAPAAGFALTPLRQPSGKLVHAWAARGDLESSRVKSNRFSMEWPPKSGKRQEFPEIDRAAWFTLDTARVKILSGQVGFLVELDEKLREMGTPLDQQAPTRLPHETRNDQ